MATAQFNTQDVKDSMPPKQFEFVQDSFAGGMNLMQDDTKIGNNEYREAFNLTNRFDKLEPLITPQEVGFEIEGNKQGIYAVGEYIFAFVGGRVYYRRFDALRFNQINTFQMSPIANRIYICAVPASNLNLQRNLLKQVDFAGNSINSNLDTIFVNQAITSSPQCIICQDGVTQPFMIFYDSASNQLLSRPIQKYEEWGLERTGNIREYVPIGLDMLFSGSGILYTFSPDRTKLYRSVTGRPLDFVVNVTASGDKGGDADTTFYSLGFAKMLSMFMASGYDGIIISTENDNTFGVKPDYDNPIFGEPTFDKEFLFNTSALNSFSIVDIGGDTAFIDNEGVKSFNGAKQMKTESGNTVFSLKIASLFKDMAPQDILNSAAVVYNSYALFGVTTTFGNIILIYDILNEVWVSMLRATAISGKIKQFISLKPYANKLYCITDDNKLVDIFPTENITTLPCELYTQSFISGNMKIEQRCDDVRFIIRGQTVKGNITNELLVDDDSLTTNTQPIRSQNKLNNITFQFTTPFIGWKVQYHLKWDGGGYMTHLMHSSTLQYAQQSFTQMKNLY